jgi:hypothetical protein
MIDRAILGEDEWRNRQTVMVVGKQSQISYSRGGRG